MPDFEQGDLEHLDRGGHLVQHLDAAGDDSDRVVNGASIQVDDTS